MTMRILRLSLAGTVLLALLGGMGGPVIGQEDEPWTADWLTPTEEHVFSSTGCQFDKSQREADYGPGGGEEIRGLRWICEVTFSDPRLSSTQTTIFNEHCFVEGGCVNWGTMEIVGADGTRRGWFTGTEDPEGRTGYDTLNWLHQSQP